MTKQQLIDMGIDEEKAAKIAEEFAKQAKTVYAEAEKAKTELADMKKQLAAANKKSAEYEQASTASNETAAELAKLKEKYEKDTAALKQTIADKDYDHAIEKFMSGFKFSSELARQAASSALRGKKFKQDENGKFIGADEFMESLKKDNPAAFDDEKAKNVPYIMTGSGVKTENPTDAARAIMGLK